jgi:acyl carrier protein
MQKNIFLMKFAESLTEDSSRVQAETALNSLTTWDSMGKVSFLSFLDDEFHFQPEPGDLDKCQTVADIMAMLKERLTD